MRIVKKLGLLLVVMSLISLSLPAHIAKANGTTVQVNLGAPIVLDVGASQSDIPLDIKDFPDLGAGDGLGSFGFIITWDPAIINVTSVTPATAPTGYTFVPGAIDNVVGEYVYGCFAISNFISGNLTVAYLEITAVGSAGETTSISVTVDGLTDVPGDPIPATPVNAPVEISFGTLQSIAVTPPAPEIAVGGTQQFTATGNYTGGLDVITTHVTWNSATPGVATINPTTGLATAVSVGTTVITASLDGVTSAPTVTLTVIASPLVSIEVTPVNPSIALGLEQQFAAEGTYANNSTAVITGAVTWDSATPGVATIDTAGLADSVAVGTTLISATSGSISGNTTLTVTAPELISIAVTPDPAEVDLGGTLQFTATGTYTNGPADITDDATWDSATPGVATIETTGEANPGLATSVWAGYTVITAEFDGKTSPDVTLTVMVDTTVEVNSGNKIYLGVDGSKSDIPLDIKNFPDLGAGDGLGSFGFIITWDPAIINVTSVTPATAPTGYTFVPGAIDNVVGEYVYGCFAISNFISGNLTVAYLEITAVGSAGETTTLDVIVDGLTDVPGDPIPALPISAPVQISLGDLLSIAVTPTSPAIEIWQTQQFTATGTYTLGSTDITSLVTWASATPGVATINATSGLAAGVAAGTTVVTASLDGKTSPGVILTVARGDVACIILSPSTEEITADDTQTYTVVAYNAYGYYWNDTAGTTFTISPSAGGSWAANVYTAEVAGTWTVTGNHTASGITGTATLTVTPGALSKIVVTPPTANITAGQTTDFFADGYDLDNNDTTPGGCLTADATWSSSATSIASMVSANPGRAKGNISGNVTITATVSIFRGDTIVNISGTAKLEVKPATIVSIAVTPAVPAPTIALDSTQQFRAWATKSDDSIVEVTKTATWASSDNSVATIPIGGLTTAIAAGTTVITASLDGKTSPGVTLTVIDATLDSIAIDDVYQAVDGVLASVDAGESLQ
ncbi:beta strand repeat-containing protein [Chloroflexota bacterium]